VRALGGNGWSKKALKLCQIQDNSANLFCVQR
jgi:hypothetical protein